MTTRKRRNVLTDVHPVVQVGDWVLWQTATRSVESVGRVVKATYYALFLEDGAVVTPDDWVRILDKAGRCNRTAAGMPTWPEPVDNWKGDAENYYADIECEGCGVVFTPTSTSHRRCSVCAPIHRKAAVLKAGRRWRKKKETKNEP